MVGSLETREGRILLNAGSNPPTIPDVSVWHRLFMAVLSGAMLGFSFPPSPFYSLAYVGLVPFFLLVETLDGVWRILRYSYLMLLVFHIITLYWTGGFTHGHDGWMMAAGGALLLIHPLFYWLPILFFLLIRRRFGFLAALLSFPLLWVAYEYSHSLSEFSFPWITIGNSQAYDLHRIQIAEYTSVYGLSFLIVLFNVFAFILVVRLATRRWKLRTRAALITLAILAIIYFGPWLVGNVLMDRAARAGSVTKLHVGIVQPNIDPWEKWGEGFASKFDSYELQIAELVRETRLLAPKRPDLVVWPETAIPYRILLPNHASSWSNLRAQLDSTAIPVFTGLPYTRFYSAAQAPITATRIDSTETFYDDFNSATLLVPHQPVGPIYKKIVLVPFAERIPYAETFRFLIEPLKWNVGIGMWGKGQDTVVFSLPRQTGEAVPFASVICYESVYPDFVRQFVEQGAQFLMIITNDSWWGNTSGAYQHASFASFRAVENRRWIVRAANGGISGFIDPVGHMHQRTRMYTTTTIDGEIDARTHLTFYARHGDIFAKVCLFCGGLIIILAFVPKKRTSAKP
jgi:apolipoprotein N-acyltransferase